MGVTAGRTPDLAARFAAVRALTRAQPQLTLLHIGAQDTQWLVGRGDRPDAALTLPLGTARTSQPFFRHDPPTPLELEQANDAVEDALSHARGLPATKPPPRC